MIYSPRLVYWVEDDTVHTNGELVRWLIFPPLESRFFESPNIALCMYVRHSHCLPLSIHLRVFRFRSLIGVHPVESDGRWVQDSTTKMLKHSESVHVHSQSSTGSERRWERWFTIESIKRAYVQCRPIPDVMRRGLGRLVVAPMSVKMSSGISHTELLAQRSSRRLGQDKGMCWRVRSTNSLSAERWNSLMFRIELVRMWKYCGSIP